MISNQPAATPRHPYPVNKEAGTVQRHPRRRRAPSHVLGLVPQPSEPARHGQIVPVTVHPIVRGTARNAGSCPSPDDLRRLRSPLCVRSRVGADSEMASGLPRVALWDCCGRSAVTRSLSCRASAPPGHALEGAPSRWRSTRMHPEPGADVLTLKRGTDRCSHLSARPSTLSTSCTSRARPVRRSLV